MATNLRRPTSVWVAQILLFFFALIFGALLVLMAPAIVNRGAEVSLLGLLPVVTANFAMVALFVVAFWGMFRRRAYGRWLGFGMLSLIFILSVVGQLIRTPGPVEYAQFENSRHAVGGLIAQVLMAALFLALLYQLALGKRVIAFFAPGEVSSDVPPPPSFED